MGDFGALKPQRDVFIKPLPSGLKGLGKRGNRKTVRARGMDDSRKQYFPDTTVLIHMLTHRDCDNTLKTCARSLTNPSTEKRKADTRFHPNHEAICNCSPPEKES